MTKKYWVAVLLGAFLLFPAFLAGQEGTPQPPAVSVKQVPVFTYCCLPYKGPFTDMEKVIGQLMAAIQNQNIAPAGPMIGIYYNSPDMVKPEDLQWEVGFPVTTPISVRAPLEAKTWNFATVATALHVGPYEKAGETIAKIFEWMSANGYMPVGPVMERYLDMEPSKLKPEELKTEVWAPCQKVGK